MPTLTNIVPAPSSSAWTKDGVTVSGDIFVMGTSWAMATCVLPTPVAGHKYYGRDWYERPVACTTAGDGRFEYYNGEAEGQAAIMTFCQFAWYTPEDVWHIASNILSVNTVYGNPWICRNFLVGANSPCYRKELLIVDLTASFGAGNEPSKDWLDRNLPYFTGSYTVNNVGIDYCGNRIATKPMVSGAPIMYNGAAIGYVNATRTINCKGRIMSDDLWIGGHTVNCRGKYMKDNITLRIL